jgi:hypothetical protein
LTIGGVSIDVIKTYIQTQESNHNRKQVALWNDEKRKVARLHEKGINQRTDFLNKLSTESV